MGFCVAEEYAVGIRSNGGRVGGWRRSGVSKEREIEVKKSIYQIPTISLVRWHLMYDDIILLFHRS